MMNASSSNSNSNSRYSSNSNSNFRFIIPILGFALLCTLFLFSNLDFSSYSTPPVSDNRASSPVITTTKNVSPPSPVATSNPPPVILTAVDSVGSRPKETFSDLITTFDRWDQEVGCDRFQEKFKGWTVNASAVQEIDRYECSELKMSHASVYVKLASWVPDILDGLYQCRCGLSCLWTRNEALADKADVWLWVTFHLQNRTEGGPLHAFFQIEAPRWRSGHEDIFISYHASSEVQATYAGKFFRIHRSYNVPNNKRDDVLVYWSSSNCKPHRDEIAKKFLSLVSHHSMGKCLNNVGDSDMALTFYPDCQMEENPIPHWWDHLHCAMSHYKFVLAIENTFTESYVTEKLYYALDVGAVPIYFGAPNVWDLVPPNSIIDASKFKSIEELADYVKAVGKDPVAYAEFHAWRRCGVMGNYGKVRLASLDTLPCRLCEEASVRGGRKAPLTTLS
ncbi:hypothetical protein LUZ63_004850 [Rhynchospora breviuscula]|uniref:Fucosyltransferase n=1 Tax=Rhynchospora breviuscula TaxID=2022672 RepID=A0A9Q0CLT8_9POAL|nr:hypothetical protein LUZ63_004850 [Rhynchospora breviuscula]